MNGITRWVLGALILAIAGCAGKPVSRNLAFDGASDKALVVMAVSTFGASAPYMVWVGFDPETRILNENRQPVSSDNAAEKIDLETYLATGKTKIGEKLYYVFEVEAGGHTIEQIISYITIGIRTTQHSTLYRANTPAFVALPGKVNYIGDYELTGGFRGLNLRSATPNLEKATEVIRRVYPNVTAPVHYQQTRRVSLDCRSMRKTLIGTDSDYCAPGDTSIIFPE